MPVKTRQIQLKKRDTGDLDSLIEMVWGDSEKVSGSMAWQAGSVAPAGRPHQAWQGALQRLEKPLESGGKMNSF